MTEDELGTTKKQIPLVALGGGLEAGTSRLQHQRPKPLGQAVSLLATYVQARKQLLFY